MGERSNELRDLATRGHEGRMAGRLSELETRIAVTQIDETAATEALAAFDPIWETLTPKEQTRIVQLLVARVDYDGGEGKIAITFKPSGIQALAGELETEAAA